MSDDPFKDLLDALDEWVKAFATMRPPRSLTGAETNLFAAYARMKQAAVESAALWPDGR